jgi:phage terminase large subunit
MAGALSWLRGKLLRWRHYPIEMVREEFGVEPDPWQAQALTAFARDARETRIALKACKGPGKTALLAWLGLNFLMTRPNPKIGATSITEGNLDMNLWPEFSKWGTKSAACRSMLTFGKSRIFVTGEDELSFIAKRTWPKTGDPESQSNALAGLHGDYVMWLCDESGGYPQSLMVTLEAIFASCIEGKLVQSGNPTHTTGPLYRACTVDRHLWIVITITGDPDDAQRSPRISLEWARQQIASYGRDNPWVMVNVLGMFPPASINALLGVEDVEAAQKRHLSKREYDHAQKRLGVDVARFGDDRTVIFPRQGLAAFKPVIMRGARTTEIAARIMLGMRKWGAELALVDDTGHWGHGVIDNLVTAGVPAIGINYAGKALNPRYKNRRVEMWLKGADAIKGGAALPPIPEMVPELTEPTYTFVNGVFLLEEKDQIKARLGRSPDLADAYMTSYALEDMPGEVMQKLLGASHARTMDDAERDLRERLELVAGRAALQDDGI